MSSPAFEVALARLYTDTSFREQFLRDPGALLAHLDLTAAEQADLAAIDRTGLVMAAASYSAKRSRHAARRGRMSRLVRQYLAKLLCTFACLALPVVAQQVASPRDGQHDFDFEVGSWKTHVSRLTHPLSGSSVWAEYDGSTVVRKVWNGKANLVELEVDGPAGHLELLSLRLYNPQSHQWSLNVTSSAGAALGVPTIGEFKNGRGEFIDQESFNGRAILVRFVIFDMTPDSCHFEQAFSDDEGKTWEVNWRATDTRTG